MSTFKTVAELVPFKEICHIYVQIILIQSGGAYRTSKHAYLIEFVCNTRVCVCDFLPRALTGFQPVAFRDILDGLVNTEYLVDVIDQIVGVSHFEIVSLNGKDTEKITLELQNQLSDRLTVHLLGKYAIFVHDATQNLIQKKCIICVIRFAKIGVFKGNLHQQRYIVMCTIAAIDYDMGWYYMSCKICWKRVLLVPSDHMKNYYCAKCNNYRSELLPRYNLQLVVLDNTGHSKFLLLDNLAEELLGIPCVALYGSSSDQIEDPVVVHSVLSKLVGGTYFCKIVIEEQNFMFNCQTFKVLEIIPTYEF
ncbi:hypothetical protein BRARA_A02326 [Brassica rapa]|uniref:Replication factor A C-terminal domain-containing protein n=1 Tax=Brassica campestris TaxID=3711 RepID=A0A398APL3_BRACM|nr:hypothetical protein BRARA_A02326 [Brassica rapa]